MLVLYRFSTYPEVPNLNWSLDLNQGPKDYESSALTAELMAQVRKSITETVGIGQDGDAVVDTL